MVVPANRPRLRGRARVLVVVGVRPGVRHAPPYPRGRAGARVAIVVEVVAEVAVLVAAAVVVELRRVLAVGTRRPALDNRKNRRRGGFVIGSAHEGEVEASSREFQETRPRATYATRTHLGDVYYLNMRCWSAEPRERAQYTTGCSTTLRISNGSGAVLNTVAVSSPPHRPVEPTLNNYCTLRRCCDSKKKATKNTLSQVSPVASPPPPAPCAAMRPILHARSGRARARHRAPAIRVPPAAPPKVAAESRRNTPPSAAVAAAVGAGIVLLLWCSREGGGSRLNRGGQRLPRETHLRMVGGGEGYSCFACSNG